VLVDGGAFVRGVEAVLEDPNEFLRFPALVSAAARGRLDVDISRALASRGSLCAGYMYDCLPHFSAGVYLSVLCRDEAPFMNPSALRRATARVPGLEAALGANPYLVACPAWKVPPADPSVHAPVDTSVPVLTMSAQFDPFSPPSLTRRFVHSFATSFPIEIPASPATPAESLGCQLLIRDTWLDRPSSPPAGTSCLRSLSFEFTTR
jgi:hypothetical protein